MGHPVIEGIVTVAILVVGVASLSVVLSKKSNTVGVIHAGASALGNNLAVAMSPVTGANVRIDTSYPDAGYGMPNLGSVGMPTLA